MFQQRAARLGRRFFVALALCANLIGCDRTAAPDAPPRSIRPSVVSLVPAATDLLIGMGAAEHLVAVSNWEPADRAETAALPRVGDYRTVDWEKLAQLRPDVMIVQFRPDKMPPGLSGRAQSMGIRLVNVKNNRLEDVFATMRALGEAIGQPETAGDAEQRVRAQLLAVQTRIAGRPMPRTLISRTPGGLDVVGGGNFLDEILTLAGGANVLPGGENSFPTIDREMLLSLDPDVVLQLLPGATPQEVEQARQFWRTLPQLRAVKRERVHIMTESHLLLPGYSVGRIAETFARMLHPDAFESQTPAGMAADKDRP